MWHILIVYKPVIECTAGDEQVIALMEGRSDY